MKYILGLDLGITSIGWAVFNVDSNSIFNCGVRLFDAAENPKDKSSLALPRREARGQRRRIRRRAYRIKMIRKLMVDYSFIKQEELDSLFCNKQKTINGESRYDIYELRYIGLSSLLTNIQLVQILIYLAKHRGFKSNRKKDKLLDGKVNTSLEENKKIFEDNGYQTIGEMLYKDIKFSSNKRNRFGEYRVMLQRSDIEMEAKIILEKQMQLGNQLINQLFIDEYIKIFNQQKSFDWNHDIIKMVGSCGFEKNEKRAPKACFSSEKFIALSKLNNIILTNIDTGEKRRLSNEEIVQIIDFILSKTQRSPLKINFANLRNELLIGDEWRFNFIKYKSDTDFFELEKKEVIKELSFISTMELKYFVIGNMGQVSWFNLFNNIELLDKIGIDLTYNKTDDKIVEALKDTFNSMSNNLSLQEQEQLIKIIIDNGIGFDKNINLSLKVLYKVIPYLEQGHRYDEACLLAGYHHSSKRFEKYTKLPSIQALGLDYELTNPIVIRAISQVRKVINAVIDKYGTPYQINIELARDIGKSIRQRDELTKRQKNNQEFNDKLKIKFYELFGRQHMKDELLKFKLWKQQAGRCIYSYEPINPSSILHGTNLTQVDHIIPYSRSFNDSLVNKVLCLTSENQRKGNQIPFEYIAKNGHNEVAWHKFIEYCDMLNKTMYNEGFTRDKLTLLLLKKFDEQGFIDRNLNDTRYIARFMLNYLSSYLKFSDDNNKKPVRVITGQATAFIRKSWGLHKSREENNLHHAQDACIIAAVNESMIQKITKYMQARSYGRDVDGYYTDPTTGEVFNRFPIPNNSFREEVIEQVSKVFVSRMLKHKITGKVHDDSIRSSKYVDNRVPQYNSGKPFSTINKPLLDSKIKLNKDNDIDGLCPTYKQHNPNIYRLLVERLMHNNNDVKKAFIEPLYAPQKDGSPSNTLIKTIKITQPQNTGVRVNDGIADNGGMVRIDIFHKAGKNYIVPVYLSDTIKDILPNRAIVASKDESEWKVMDDSYRFLYSFYQNDLIKIETKKEVIFGYYTSAHRVNGTLNEVKFHDGSKKYTGVGIQTAIIEKYQVDVLGNYYKIHSEKRMSFNN